MNTGKELVMLLNAAKNETDRNEIYLQLKELKSFDEEYFIPAIRDVLVGDRVLFLRARYKPRAKNEMVRYCKRVEEMEVVRTMVVGESFSDNVWRIIYEEPGCESDSRYSRRMIKADNLWSGGIWRRPWSDEDKRKEIRIRKYGK
jgi:hypothetical protein